MPETAAKMVQIYVSHLRKVLPPGTLDTRPPGYSLQLEHDQLDLHRFERLVADARAALDAGRPEQAAAGFRSALELWRGPALTEFGAEPFAAPEAARLEELRISALEGRLEADFQLGRHNEVAAELEALVGRYPLREGLRGQHMLALYRSGRQAEALAAYQDARRVLADELGIEPSQALRDLERRILQQDSSLDPAQPRQRAGALAVPRGPDARRCDARRPGSRSRSSPRCARRFAAWRAAGRLRLGRGGNRQVDARRRLGRVRRRGTARRVRTMHRAARRRRAVHAGARRARPDLRLPARGEAQPVLLDRAPTWALQMPSVARPHMREKLRQQVLGATRERMLRELVEALDALAALQPVVLVLEDLHWSDHSTVDLLAPVARRREPARLLVIGTYRPADARTRAHPIHTTAQELRLRGLASEVALASFRETDVEAYLRSRLNGHELPDDLPRLLVERTGGNPLFLEKVVDAWIEHGLVRRDERGWRAVADRDDLTRAIPETLRELITQRLSEVSEEDRQILEAASVAGPEFAAALVAAASGLEEDEVEARCDALAEGSVFLVSRAPDGWPDGTFSARYGFTHELCQEVLYDSLSPARRARLHRAIGARLATAFAGRSREIAAELAAHFVRGGDASRAVEQLVAAAEQALDRRAPREAIVQLQSALELLGNLDDGPERAQSELHLQALLGPALITVNGWSSEDAEAALLRARQLTDELGRAEERAWSNYKLATMYEVRGRYEAAEALLEETLAERGAGGLSVDSYELLACTLFHQGVFTRALESAERGLAVHDVHQNPWTAEFGENPARRATAGPRCRSGSWAIPTRRATVCGARSSFRAAGAPSRSRDRVCARRARRAMPARRRRDADDGWGCNRDRNRDGIRVSRCDGHDPARVGAGGCRSVRRRHRPGPQRPRARTCGRRANGRLLLPRPPRGRVRARRANRGGLGRRRRGTRERAARGVVSSTSQSCTGSAGGSCCASVRARREKTRSGERSRLRRRRAAARSNSAVVSLARVPRRQGSVDEARSLLVRAHAAFTEGFETADLRAASALLRGARRAGAAPTPAARAERQPHRGTVA